MLILHQIPVSEPDTDGSGAFMLSCWRGKGLRIGKSESRQAQFLISQLKKGRSREGKWLTQCHIFSGRAKSLMKGSTELGVRSLGSDNTNHCPCPFCALCPMGLPQASGYVVVPRAILMPDVDSSRNEEVLVLCVTGTHTIILRPAL